MITLRKHIDDNHNGSQKAFADANGLDKQTVWRMLQKGYWYVSGTKLLMHKRDINNKGKTDE